MNSNKALVTALSVAIPALLGHAQTPAATTPDIDKVQAQLQADSKKLADWPNLARYRDEDERIRPGTDTAVFMGDSITDGWGRKYGEFFPGKPYLNRGISGQTTPQMLLRFRQDVLDLKPKVVVILGGTNDIAGNTGPESLEEIEGYLQSMTELAQADGIRVVLSSLTPVCDCQNIQQTVRRSPGKIIAINAWMKAYAKRRDAEYLDYYDATIDENKMFRKDLTRDGLHPNAEGYAVMGPLAEKAISRALENH
ncbi:MAG TPA: SGNH/GDSL hydrolase family protein [Bryobacteraceae bacterium]|jgi:lysophospholipase L1-like esterase|nr:SGNH/GDSL hydrolase family protein [Bryobacteraceae bacterium]